MSYGLLGQKLAHSYSPAIHANFGGYNYALFEIEPQNLEAFMQNEKFAGLNVTIPYKQAVIPYCAEISPTAKEIGSINTIIRRPDGGLYGENTDATGFKKMLEILAVPVAGKKAIIFGRGGSSLSTSYILRQQNIGEIVTVHSQNNTPEFLRQHKDAKILINCTPVGMYPNVSETPANLHNFPALEAVYDLIYNPARTRLLMDAAARKIPHIGGLPMLVGQAAAASEMFTGRPIPESKIRATLNKLRNRMENIILIGMPGSGKSTHGRIIAEKLSKTFIDTDAETARTANQTIPEIFAAEGEAGFRKKETETIAKYGKESGLVIATGGGAVTRPENYPHLHQNGTIIFTPRATADLCREDRPLSQGDLEALHRTRLPMYQSFADHTVPVDGNPDQTAQKIIESLGVPL
jgi:shikimate dehydrogenase